MMWLNPQQLKEKLGSHLRRTARQLVKFNTLDETLHYLLEFFWMEFPVILSLFFQKKNKLVPTVWKGETIRIEEILNVVLDQSSPNLLQDALDSDCLPIWNSHIQINWTLLGIRHSRN